MSEQLPDLSADAKRRLPQLWSDVVGIVDSVHPIELLCQLSLLLMHPEDEFPDVEQHARLQVRIELVVWYLLQNYKARSFDDVLIGADILGPLEESLDAYFAACSLSMMEPPSEDPEEVIREELRFLMKSEALHVRGEGIPSQVKYLSLGLYGPHEAWFRSNLGFTIEEAFIICEAIFDIISLKLHQRKADALSRREEALEEYRKLLTADATGLDEARARARKGVETIGAEVAADRYCMAYCFHRLRDAVGVSSVEIVSRVLGKCSEVSVNSFLERMSQELGTVTTQPDPIGFNPLAERPLILHEGSYYLPVPPAMYDALLSTFHFDIWRDETYRDLYDLERAKWLEEEALTSLGRLFRDASIHRNLMYGPKRSRQELDGLIWFDNKLILIECKWKSVTLAARMGNVDALRVDLDKSIVAAFSQAKRARDFLRGASGPVVFTDANGVDVLIDPSKIAETYQISLLGRGAFAVLAANLPRLAPVDMFDAADFPWALSLLDLSVVCDLLDFPSQLFDYLKRRDGFVREKRSLVHDEWDMLGLYLDGRLDLSDPEIENMQFIVFDKADGKIDQYLRSKADPRLADITKPARNIPEGLREFIAAIEASDQLGRSDFIVALLGLSDQALSELWDVVERTTSATERDAKIHSAYMQYSAIGFAFVCSSGEPERMNRALTSYCLARKYRTHSRTCLGIGVDLSLPKPPHTFAYFHSEWNQDTDLERIALELLGPETA